jgi:predicted ester cyclase
MTDDVRAATRRLLADLLSVPEADLPALARGGLTAGTAWDVAFPIGRLEGPEAVVEGLVLPLRRALAGVHRRDEIVIGGANRRPAGGRWVAAITHYVGNFVAPLAGIAPCDRLVFLRSGEFWRIAADGRIEEAKLIVDFLDLMRQAGRFPLPRMLGTEMLFPGPATHDGVLPAGGDGAASLDLVEAMLGDLHAYDPETLQSRNQTGAGGYWDDRMLWYGPAGIGSSYTWRGFEKDHRAAFLHAFPDRKGGNHYCRIGDGNYAAVGGWPSMTMTHRGAYLGVPATGRALTLRVMDFYRCAGGKIAENWVLLDYLDLFDQMGVDLIARAAAMEPSA